jgi:(1->4)-alpha-D-glucan 1-alpha-D-glucosylmutase
MHNSLVQTVLKLTVPGVPDIYQGAELWDFSLVDPDNRRPVDYAVRRSLLGADMEVAQARDGRLKLRFTRDLLRLRRQHPDLFGLGSYEALIATGVCAERIVAFARQHEGTSLLVATALFPAREMAWSDEQIVSGQEQERWTSLLDGREITARQGALAAADLFATLPVAVLMPAKV